MDDTLYLLDGYSVIYRSYFAFFRNPLRNPQGENSSAVFGFFRTLFALFRDYQPQNFAVIMDSRVPTFRHEQYEEYKANRQETPDDLHAQIPVIEEILQALGVSSVRVDRYEADDVMATLAERCRKKGRACRVISGDKDLLQLVGDPVRILRPGKDGIDEMDRDAVYRDWQVWPEQIRDFLALIGDASDNIPGVKGIGKKTAADLLGRYGTLDNLYGHLEELSPNRRSKLEEGRAAAFLSRDLISLASDAPLPPGEDRYELKDLDYEAAAPLMIAQGMKKLVEQTGGSPGAPGRALPTEAGPEETRRGDELSPSWSPRERADLVLSREEREAFAKQGACELVRTREQLARWISRAREAKIFAFDVETDSLDALTANPLGFSLACSADEACYIPLRGPEGAVFDEPHLKQELSSLLTDPACRIVGQNFKFDYKILSRWGIRPGPVYFDTMIAAWLVDTSAGGYGMDRLALDYLGYQTISFDDLFSSAPGSDENESGGKGRRNTSKSGNSKAGRNFGDVPLDQAARYAGEDAYVTYRLYTVLDRLLDRRGVRDIFESLEMPLVPILADMETVGIGLDVFALEQYSGELSSIIEKVEREIHELAGHAFNIASTKQLQEVLFQERKLQPVKKTKTGFSTDTAVLQELAREDPLPERVLEYRMFTKLRSTYVDALPKMVNPRTGRIHTSLNQTGTATGRLSSAEPNLQNIPIRDTQGRRIRDAFVPRQGWIFVSADYSQIELVVLAHLSRDEALMEAFRTGEDVHSRTAGLIFGVSPEAVSAEQRRIAKTINFGVMYGMSAFRLSNELGLPRKEAEEFIKTYFGTYQGIGTFIDETVARAEKDGEVRTLLGRPRPVPDILSRNRTVKSAVERVVVNTPIQGTAADIVKKAMLAVSHRLGREGLQAQMILQVHDELILECPPHEEETLKTILLEEMSGAVALSVPLRVSVESGDRWGAMHQ
ncbi:DNA polymerase I [Alkalispirochaeta americana]|uniref:DNA polymerase I n=1 Tax=Alkalispirochaeta americana TaxID=159291 RepID=A0A1N6TE27_9SPIO|nr:DNA polymerase I [Alkalispirochaeta americana]SIQ51507.1 DNA polymerase I [Alkalispirochaeta americana]